MNNSIPILLGSIFIGGAIVGAQFVGRYQFVPAVDHDEKVFFWRLDERSGEVQRCTFSQIFRPDEIDPKTGAPDPFKEMSNSLEGKESGPRWQFSCTTAPDAGLYLNRYRQSNP